MMSDESVNTYEIRQKIRELEHYDISGRYLSTVIIILFFVHPTITQFSFANFQCVDIDGENLVKVSIDIPCWDAKHLFFSLLVSLPTLVFWGLGIPFFALVMLIKHRHVLY